MATQAASHGAATQAQTKSQTGADLVVRMLENHGTTHVFGVTGGKIIKLFDSLVDSKIQTVVCRHEQNAAFIAGAIGRMTGKAGVAIATSGPGVSNLVTGLSTATAEGDPLVALGGSVSVADHLKLVHQTMDSVSVCKPVTKYAAQIDSPVATAEVLAAAFRAAETGRPGAAFVSLPTDIMAGEADCRPFPFRNMPLGAACADALEEAARLINAAKAPVVLLGLMASKAGVAASIQQFLTKTPLPVVGTFQAAGAISQSLYPFFGGRVGQIANQPADKLLAAADLVITIGYDPIEYWPTLWNAGRDRTIVHIDVVPAEYDNNYVPAVELIGGIEPTLKALSPLLSRPVTQAFENPLLAHIAKEREELKAQAAKLSGVPIHPLRIISELQDVLSSDCTVCSDMGSFSIYLSRYLHSFRARQFLLTNGQQTLGVALPWAIAATIVRPKDKVLSVSGDGGFLFSAMELETAVRLKSHLVHMIWIDGSYDMVANAARLKYHRTAGTAFGPVDPVKYAEAFGATGFQIQTPDQIAPTLRKAFDTPGPVLVGVHVDYSQNAKLFEMVYEGSIL
jgi:acetolactate synthase I/II/III large subunit